MQSRTYKPDCFLESSGVIRLKERSWGLAQAASLAFGEQGGSLLLSAP